MNFICRRAVTSLGGRIIGRNEVPITLRFLASYSTAETGSKEHVDSLVKKDDIVVFMKGSPEQPLCGFSNVVIQILRMHGVENYGNYNVLDDDSLRQGIKDYSNWPTIPQVFFKGEFIGGSDILLEMHQNGSLVEELTKLGIRSALLDEEEKKQE